MNYLPCDAQTPLSIAAGDGEGLGVGSMKQYQAARLLRRQQTPAEACLWAALRDHKLDGLHFRRQHPLGGFIADFYCPQAKLAVEVDGGIHHTPQQAAYDRDRDTAFALMGVTV